jgi:hypothetical protein
LTETILPPDANRTETHPIPNGPAPRVSPDGSVQLLTRRRVSRELFPSSWLRTPAEVRHAGGITEGTRLEFYSTELILQAKEGRTSIQKMAAGLRDLNNVPEVTWEDVASQGGKVMKEIGERDSRCLALPDMLAVA